jgi:hypothetical protein
MSSVYQIKVTLNDSKPPIWRRVLVEDTTTLSKLHTILQTVMGWTDSHLHQFIINDEFYGEPDDEFSDIETKNEKRYHLNQFVERKGFKFIYEYDFGDSWEHTILIEAILPIEKGAVYPRCIEGKRACPPEDVGGVWGYEDFQKVIADPQDPEYEQMMEWLGVKFDPERFNLDHVNEGLRHPRRARMEGDQDFYEPPQTDNKVEKNIVNWAAGLDKKQLALVESSALRRDMATFLSYLNKNRVVGTQATGNLPLKAVREICAQFVNPPALEEKIGDKVYKIRSEDDVYLLYYLHTLANIGGFVMGGQARVWKLTTEGYEFLNAPASLQLSFMLALWWYQTDWRIAFPVSGLDGGLPKGFDTISLKRLLELPVGKSISYEPFADQLIKETCFTWASLDQDASKSIRRSAIARLVIYPLANFGILEYEYKEKLSDGYKSKYLAKIRLTSFGKGLLGIL